MNESYEEYYNIVTFKHVFTEIVSNLSDPAYAALWYVYRDLVHDSYLRKEASILFAPDEKKPSWAVRKNIRHVFKTQFDFIRNKERYNIGRQTLKRYNMLLANEVLRKKVFGI